MKNLLHSFFLTPQIKNPEHIPLVPINIVIINPIFEFWPILKVDYCCFYQGRPIIARFPSIVPPHSRTLETAIYNFNHVKFCNKLWNGHYNDTQNLLETSTTSLNQERVLEREKHVHNIHIIANLGMKRTLNPAVWWQQNRFIFNSFEF